MWERRNEHLVINPRSYQAAATKNARVHIDAGAVAAVGARAHQPAACSGLASEPYTRCKPAGGPRQFMSPYGLEIVDSPSSGGSYVFNTSNAHSYRIVHMDGRGHPAT